MKLLKSLIVALPLLACTASLAGAAEPLSVWLEDLTWKEVKSAISDGKTIAIIPTGGTEQNGPHIALGKHNFNLQYTAMAVAQRLGNALVAPIMEYVPEGAVSPAEGHMKFPGTLSLKPETFAMVLEDTARSLKQHGFKTICFMGEHGASQPVQAKVAEKLTAEWASQGIRVVQVGDYYDQHNGQVEWAKASGVKDTNIEAHGGFADTSEMLAVHPKAVRENLRAHHAPSDFDDTGAEGSSLEANGMAGAKLLELKVNAAVNQIKAATAAK